MKQKVALVLSSGGARGMAHIGVIEELEKLGFEISSVAGASIGSVIGGIYATDQLREYTKWVRNLHKFDVYKLMDFSVSSQGFIKGDKVFNEIQKFIPDRRIEDLAIPFAAVAADPHNRKERVFTRGSLFRAIRASIAIPGVVLPSRINDVDLVDGGVVNPIPADHVKRTDGDILVVVDLNSSFSYHKPNYDLDAQKANEAQYRMVLAKIRKKLGVSEKTNKDKKSRPGYYDLLNNSIYLMQEKLSELTLRLHKPDILIRIPRTACKTFEFYRANELIEAGREAFLKSYSEWKTK